MDSLGPAGEGLPANVGQACVYSSECRNPRGPNRVGKQVWSVMKPGSSPVSVLTSRVALEEGLSSSSGRRGALDSLGGV